LIVLVTSNGLLSHVVVLVDIRVSRSELSSRIGAAAAEFVSSVGLVVALEPLAIYKVEIPPEVTPVLLLLDSYRGSFTKVKVVELHNFLSPVLENSTNHCFSPLASRTCI
jgi:hypothetical protein